MTDNLSRFKPDALLKQVFPDLEDDEVAETIFLARVRTYPADTLLVTEGTEGDVFYIIGEGTVRITKRDDESGEDRVLRNMGPGGYFGEMALLANTPRNASVRALSNLTVMEIDKPTFIEMIRQNPKVAMSMFSTVVEWLRANDQMALSQLREKQALVESAYKELRYEEKRRSEFLTVLAHEIRTPLTTASGFMGLIRDGNMTGPALTMSLDKMATALDHMVSLVNDLLFVQEMEMIAPTVHAVDLHTALGSVVDELEERADDNDLKVVLHIPDELPKVEADPDGLIRALRALVDNAIKFSPEGGEISITVSLDGDKLNITIKDPGIGIESSYMPRIFERFEHQDKHGEYIFGGVGLGLPIAKHLIESFGGRIDVQSEVNQGSTFTVRLPILAPSSAA